MKVPTKSELDADPDNDELKKRHELNVQQAYRDIMLSVKHDSKHGKIAFGLIKNCKNPEYPEGNASGHGIDFSRSRRLKQHLPCSSTSKMSDLDFHIHILNNLPELYDVVVDGMESKLMLTDGDENKLTLESVREKLNGRYERIQGKVQEKEDHDGDQAIALLALKWQVWSQGCRLSRETVASEMLLLRVSRSHQE